uniref:Uncharacterized protein n=1 Tax=Mycena chlorophos TaxID=658473 RepID=A0ABQ0M0P1_MYCCL|nr:predicted protein [Mycena chlorophos]
MARQKATARKVLPQVGKRRSPKETQETPLTRIRKELQALVTQEFSFNGVFAFSERFPLSEPDAPPNPCLQVNPSQTGVGSVGIPLSSRDAEAFPISEEGDCRVSARDVSFGNAAWDTWMQETVMELVSEKLGLSGSATLVLEELILYTRDYGCDEESVHSTSASSSFDQT